VRSSYPARRGARSKSFIHPDLVDNWIAPGSPSLEGVQPGVKLCVDLDGCEVFTTSSKAATSTVQVMRARNPEAEPVSVQMRITKTPTRFADWSMGLIYAYPRDRSINGPSPCSGTARPVAAGDATVMLRRQSSNVLGCFAYLTLLASLTDSGTSVRGRCDPAFEHHRRSHGRDVPLGTPAWGVAMSHETIPALRLSLLRGFEPNPPGPRLGIDIAATAVIRDVPESYWRRRLASQLSALRPLSCRACSPEGVQAVQEHTGQRANHHPLCGHPTIRTVLLLPGSKAMLRVGTTKVGPVAHRGS
jgi:hypothetical protein